MVVLLRARVDAWAVGVGGNASLETGLNIFGTPGLIRWSAGPKMIDDPSSTVGLRGGIAWALDPGLCDEELGLLRLLPEISELGRWPFPQATFFE